MTPRRLGLRAAPLSAARAPGARPGRLRPCRRRRWPPDWSRPGRPGRPPPGGSGRPGAGRSPPCARRPGRTRWRRAAGRRWGRGRSNRRQAARGLLDGSALATPSRRKSLASHAGEGAFRPMEAILSCTLIGPWSSPERSRAARTSRARARTRSGRRLGPASRTARPGLARRRGPLPPARAGARRRSVLRQMPCSAQNVVTAPRGASSGHRAIARRTRGSTLRFLSGLTPQSQTTSVTTRTRRTVTDVLIQNRHPCPET